MFERGTPLTKQHQGACKRGHGTAQSRATPPFAADRGEKPGEHQRRSEQPSEPKVHAEVPCPRITARSTPPTRNTNATPTKEAMMSADQIWIVCP